MDGNSAVRKQKLEGRSKVKTGCGTCRVRRVKCDETKPLCRKCIDTGRTCDGYESPFRVATGHSMTKIQKSRLTAVVDSRPREHGVIEITRRDIDLLNRYFSTKTLLDVDMQCEEIAKQILQASLTYPPIRNAVVSLKALREGLEKSGNDSVTIPPQAPSYNYGLEQYSMALGGLASNISSPSSDGVKLTLLCCQLFISIEQVRGNYAAMAQHIIRGLGILHEYRPRPYFVATNELSPARYDQLPLLDVFITKMFLAPCKFADAPVAAGTTAATLSMSSESPLEEPLESVHPRRIAPNMKSKLKKIATSTLDFLSRVSQTDSVETALPLLSEKSALLQALDWWVSELDLVQAETVTQGSEPLSMSFYRFFQAILKIVLLGTLEYSQNLENKLKIERDRLQGVANKIGERVQTYRICGVLSDG